jgi:hypothetical protein
MSACYCISTGNCLISQVVHSGKDAAGNVQNPATYTFATYSCSGCENLEPNFSYSFIGICNSIYLYSYGTYGNNFYPTSITTFSAYLIQCYCLFPSNCACEYERLWSLKDYSETQTILDPNGTLNYLAIGYN